MNTTVTEAKLSANTDISIHPPLSEYATKLEPRVRQRYLENISAIGIDPVLNQSKNFQPDCLPPVESTDLLFYLVLETSFYTQQQFKAFTSLQSDGFGIYNQRKRPHNRKQICCVSKADNKAQNHLLSKDAVDLHAISVHKYGGVETVVRVLVT
ncbi:uncharacterized protein LOC111342709 [Stylophora pistillata]|uniref:uncharacterized protein LOC111342709 n=1 Tax=Stylophora pistillata TaxID=50429 RepID=UPI000C04E3CD|nr:uncharacterized protein LOC111342709 [Stylophora pistillata]